MGNLEFDSTNIEPSAPLDPVPAGKYPCRITASEIKVTKNGAGRYLQLTLDIADGEYKNRKLFDRLNLWNSNVQAQEIAQKTLSAICHAVGILKVRNHEELRGKALLVKATTRNDPQYGESNEVKGYEPMAGQAAVADSGSWGGDSEPSAAPVGAAPPWGKQ